MAVHRLRPADWLTGVAGVALLVLLFVPWYGRDDGETVSGWGAFAVTDVWLALTAVLAIAVALLTAARDSPSLPLAAAVVCATVSVIAVILVVLRLLALPQDALDTREWGLFAGALAVLGVTFGSWSALRDERGPGLRPPPAPRAMPTPPRETPEHEPTASET